MKKPTSPALDSPIFRRLRDRFIAITMIVTSIVLVVTFSAIYMVARGAAENRPFLVETTKLNFGYSESVIQTIRHEVQAERREASASLLLSLLVAGVAIEVVVAILSYYLAEAAIAPVKEAYDSQKTFIANASHEIKTPLAAISANLEAAEITDNPWIDNISQEIKSLTNLNQELLTLSRADQVFNRLQPSSGESVELKSTITEVASAFAAQISQRGITYEFHSRLNKPKANLARADFVQILTILLDNAVKYCDKSIVVSLKAHTFSIKNDGATISEADLPRIFDRFYQTDKSSEGVGLGLAIAKTLAEKNHWKLSAASDHSTTIFTLEF